MFLKAGNVGDGAFRRLAQKVDLELLARLAKADCLGRSGGLSRGVRGRAPHDSGSNDDGSNLAEHPASLFAARVWAPVLAHIASSRAHTRRDAARASARESNFVVSRTI